MTEVGGTSAGARGGRVHRRALAAAAIVLVLGLLLTVVTAQLVRQSAREDAAAQFAEDAKQTQAILEGRIDTYLKRLGDIGTFVAHDPGVANAGPVSFTSYVEASKVFEDLPAVVGVFFLQRVEEADFAAFQEEIRTGNPQFTLLELEAHRPGEPYYVLSYYAPGRLDLALPVGTDTYPVQSVTALIEASRRSGAAVAGSFQDDPLLTPLAERTNYQQLDEMLDLDFFLGVPVRGVGEQQDETVGWVGATIDGFDSVLDEATASGNLGAELQVDLTDAGLGTDQSALERKLTREGGAGPLAATDADLRTTTTIPVAGIDWTLTTWAAPEAAATPGSVLIILVGGTIGSLLAAAITYLRFRSSEQRAAFAAALADRMRMQQDILDSVNDAMVVLDADGRILSSNPAWRLLWSTGRPADSSADGDGTEDHADTGVAADETVAGHPSAVGADLGRDYLARMAPNVRAARSALDAGVHGVLDGSLPEADTDVALEQGSRRRWFAVRVTPLGGEQGGAVVVHTDITERKRSQDELEMKASHDPLTGLLNREAFESEVTAALQHARVTGDLVAVIFMDLDDFKPINDTFGHAVGDDVLRAIAQRIGSAVRTTDRVARLGGDEFVALVSPLHDPTIAEQTAERIRRALAQPVHVAGNDHRVRASIGVALADAPLGFSADALIHRADEAMYTSKQSGGNQVTVAS